MPATYNSSTTAPYPTLEYQKFVELTDYTNWPAVSANYYGDDGLSGVNVFNKTAMLVVLAEPLSLSGANVSIGGVSVNGPLSGSFGSAASTAWGGVSALTSATGTNFVTFPSTLAKTCTVINSTGVTIMVKNASVGIAFPISTNTAVDINLVANCNEISFQRQDVSNTQVSVFGMYTNYL